MLRIRDSAASRLGTGALVYIFTAPMLRLGIFGRFCLLRYLDRLVLIIAVSTQLKLRS